MAVQLPPNTPPALAQTLAEAALQRQSFLLSPAREGAAPTEAGAAAATPSAANPPGSPPTALPPGSAGSPGLRPPAEQVSVSAQARAQILADLASGVGGARAGPGSAAASLAGRTQATLQTGAGPSHTPGTSATTGLQASAPAQWPASGVTGPLRGLLNTAVAQLTAQAQQPQRITAAQPWPAGLQTLVAGARPAAGTPALQTWLVGQGTVQTEQGARHFTLTLQAPAAWAQAQPKAAQGAMPPGAPLLLRMEGRAESLQSGTWALVLQSSAGPAGGARSSALLTFEFSPLLPATVYGREMLLGRSDPWLMMAALQASGQLPRDDDAARRREEALCVTVGCPYAGRASCEQPFCAALHTVLPAQSPELPPQGT